MLLDRPDAVQYSAVVNSSGKSGRRALKQEAEARGGSPEGPEQLMSSLMRAAGVVERRIETALETVNLSAAKFMVLQDLAEAGEPLALSELAERRTCVRSNITQLVDRLESEELVQRVDDPADRRVIRARLTVLGKERYVAAAKIVAEVQAEVSAELPAQERNAVCRFLSKFC
jgi:DNA-binding MarR family transcriptional regulator